MTQIYVTEKLAQVLIDKYLELRGGEYGIIEYSDLFTDIRFPAAAVYTKLDILYKLNALTNENVRQYLANFSIPIQIKDVYLKREKLVVLREGLTESEAQARLLQLEAQEKALQAQVASTGDNLGEAMTKYTAARNQKSQCEAAVEQIQVIINQIKDIIVKSDEKRANCVYNLNAPYATALAEWKTKVTAASDPQKKWSKNKVSILVDAGGRGQMCRNDFGGDYDYTGGTSGMSFGFEYIECALKPDVINQNVSLMNALKPTEPDYAGMCQMAQIPTININISCVQCNQLLNVTGSNNIMRNISMASSCVSSVVANSYQQLAQSVEAVDNARAKNDQAVALLADTQREKNALQLATKVDDSGDVTSDVADTSNISDVADISKVNESTESTESKSDNMLMWMLIIIFAIIIAVMGTIIMFTQTSNTTQNVA